MKVSHQKMVHLSEDEIQIETDRLYDQMKHINWTREDCSIIAPITLEINQLKRQRNAVILAHSYQKPQIIFGVADFVGDSYGLSKMAMEVDAEQIIFCGVKFMAETAKILNPDKIVFLPSLEAGCSLADGITAEDVRQLKTQYPDHPVICYVNTTAAVKAECDICVTSANAEKILNSIESNSVIFLPDKHMAKNLRVSTGKQIIDWNAECIVHNQFSLDQILHLRDTYPGIKILAHSECDPSVAAEADLVGGTGDMIRYVEESSGTNFALITECGLSERLQVDFPDKKFLGSCVLCPFMKTINLENVYQVLQSPRPDQVIDVPLEIRQKARKSLDRMFELSV